MDFDAQIMSRCIQIAQNGAYYVAPNPMVGAVLVSPNGTIFAEGWHKQYGGPHAEVNCFADADKRSVPDELLHQSTLYVSLEPCSHYGHTPPCAELIIRKGIKRVVVGLLDPNPLVAGNGVKMLRNAGIEVTVGVLETECRDLNKRFLCLQEKHRPYVTLKWAQTADGFMDGEISSPFTKRLVHEIRAMNMAIMVGTNTVLNDNPKLLTTHWAGRHPLRVTVDRHHRIPKGAKIFSDDAETLVYRDNTDWEFILKDLASRGVHSIMVEGGPTLLKHILSTGIYDELHIEVGPALWGQQGTKAPEITLPVAPTAVIDGHRLYVIKH